MSYNSLTVEQPYEVHEVFVISLSKKDSFITCLIRKISMWSTEQDQDVILYPEETKTTYKMIPKRYKKPILTNLNR